MGIQEDSNYDVPISGSLTALNSLLELDLIQKDSHLVTITGTWVGTISFQISADGTNWIAATTVNLASGAVVSSSTANGSFVMITAGCRIARVIMTAYTSGTAVIASEGSQFSQYITVLQGSSPWITKDQSDGPVTPGTAASFSQLVGGQFNTVLPTLTTGQQAAFQLDSSGRLITAPQTTTVGIVDKTAFTYGISSFQDIGGVYQDTSPSLTAGQSGSVRLSQNRALHTQLRNDAGTEVGTPSNPLRTDPTGTTTQPVSGTVAVTQGTSPWVTSRSWALASGTDSVSAVQSGAWSVSVSNFPVDADALAQGSTTSGQLGALSMGAVTTAAPTYTTGTTNSLSLTTTGFLRVDGSGVTQPISATSLPLPTGAATSALQTTGNTSLASIDTKLVQLALNYGVATGALRVASQIGNTTGAADFNAGATGAQTLRTTSNLATAGTALTSTLIGAKQSLDVNVVNTTPVSTTTGVADKTTFTYGTTLEQPIGGVYQDTSPSLTAGTTGAVRVTQNRGLHTNLRDSAGNEKIGQQTMANSIPVVMPSDQSLNVNVTAEIYSSYTPDYGSIDTGTTGPLNQDASGNLNVRGPVLSDEGTIRDDFASIYYPGSTVYHSLTGTLTFTNGSTQVTGTGTAFTTETLSGSYIKKTSDSETLYLQIDYVLNDTTLFLVSNYAGTTATTTGVISIWATTTGTGGSLTVASSILTIASGTTNGSNTNIFHEVDYLPFSLQMRMKVSQRIANQEIVIGMLDSGTNTPNEQACIVFNGTNNKQVILRTSSGPTAADIQETTVTLPSGGITSDYHIYQVDLTSNQAALVIDGTVMAVNNIHMPQPYTVLGMYLGATNNAVVTNTNILIDYVYFANLDQIQITNDFKGEPIPSLMMGQNSNGLATFLTLDQYGNLIVSPLGGLGADFAFGDINTAGTNTQAVRRTVYTEQSTNGQRSFASSSASDSSAGTGVQQLILEYFDATGAGPFTETITLSGLTRVNTVATNICFIESLKASRVGSGGVAAGIITLYTTPTSGGTAIGSISAGTNQTFWAHHYVATGKTCRVAGLSGATDLTSSSFVLLLIRSKPIGVTGAAELQISDSIKLYGGASEAQRNYNSPITVPGPALVTLYATPGSNSSQNVFGSFDFSES